MTCPKCGGKTKVIDISHAPESLYRRRRCTVCAHDFYTSEAVVESTTSLRSTFRKHNRNTKYYLDKVNGGSMK